MTNTGSINTSAIDGYRQGVSLRTHSQRYASTQPKMWVGSLSHEIRQASFDDVVVRHVAPHDDVDRLTLSSSVAIIFSGSAAVLDVFDQIQERRGVQVVSTVSGEFCQGSRGDPVEQCVHLSEVRLVEPYVELGTQTLVVTSSYTATGGSASGSIVSRAELLDSFTQPETEHVIRVFDDAASTTSRLPRRYMTAERVQFASAMQQLSSSTDVFEFERRLSAAAGFVYHSTTFGTDSLAFGGLTRYTT